MTYFNSKQNDLDIKSLELDDLISYLEKSAWKAVDKTNRWVKYHGSEDIFGDPVEIFLPINQGVSDIENHKLRALNTLATVNDIEPEILLSNIKHHDRDILRVINSQMNSFDSVSINLAARQVDELKKLFAYSAYSELYTEPYVSNTRRGEIQKILDDYQFGHTFKGSFGYTIKSPTVTKSMFATQQTFDDRPGVPVIPFSRKVLTRIVRGLKLTAVATQERDPEIIIQNYHIGFNSNMCSSIIDMSEKTIPLDYHITWSSKFPPTDDDIRDINLIRLSSEDYRVLEYAAKELKEHDPEKITLEGRVTDLSADDNPLGVDTQRTIALEVYDYHEDRKRKIYIYLKKDDYIKAIEAHEKWLSVKVTGELKKVGNRERFVSYSSFEVIEHMGY